MGRFVVLDVEDSPKWKDGFSTYIKPCFTESADDVFDVCRVALGDPLPGCADYDGFVISGSHYNVRDCMPWQEALAQLVRDIANLQHTADAPRLLGICFGHQLICHALGGAVGYNPGSVFVLASEQLVLSPALAAMPFASDLVEVHDGRVRLRDVRDEEHVTAQTTGDELLEVATKVGWAGTLGLLESHGDCVTALPTGAVLLASSPTCAHELVLSTPNILSCQGHPEFDYTTCIAERIWPAVVGERKRLSHTEQAASLASFAQPRHSRLLVEMLRRFLRRRGAA